VGLNPWAHFVFKASAIFRNYCAKIRNARKGPFYQILSSCMTTCVILAMLRETLPGAGLRTV
jgi:hypothetical protein